MWFYLAVITSILSAISTVYGKHILKSINASVMTFALSAIPLPFLAFYLTTRPLPQLNSTFFLGLISSSILYVASKNLSMSAIKAGNLSSLIPLGSLGTLITYAFGVIILSETISPISLTGIITIILGAYIFNLDQARGEYLLPITSLFTNPNSLKYLTSVGFGSLVGITDKLSLNNSLPNDPIFLLFCQSIVTTFIMLIYLILNKKSWVKQIKTNFTHIFIASFIYAVFVIVAFTSFTKGPVILTMGILNTRVFLIFLLSYLFFKDKPTKHKLFGSLIMIIGVIITKS